MDDHNPLDGPDPSVGPDPLRDPDLLNDFDLLGDPDPSVPQDVSVQSSAEYHLAYDAAFDVLRIDLGEVRGGADLEMYGEALYVLGRLDHLRSLYQAQIDAEGGGYVPSGISDWTIADEVIILRHLAAIIHDRHLSEAALGDEHRMRKFWEYGHLRSVEKMCHDARQDQETARSRDLHWLMDNWALRHASEAAELTSQNLGPDRRTRRRANLDSAESVASMSRTPVERGQAEPFGR